MKKVSIIITSYLKESKPYLDLCIESVQRQTYSRADTEVIVVTPNWYRPEYPRVRVVHPSKKDYCNEHAMNFGFNCANPDADYFFYMNDDVVLTEDCLKNMVEWAEGHKEQALLMPISNDQQHRYQLSTGAFIKGSFKTLYGPYRLDDLAPYKSELMAAKSHYVPSSLVFETLCTYCFLISKSNYQRFGPIDEKWQKCGPSDIDYCLRVSKSGYKCAVVLHALAWHFGGVSATQTLSQDDREYNKQTFDKKWN